MRGAKRECRAVMLFVSSSWEWLKLWRAVPSWERLRRLSIVLRCCSPNVFVLIESAFSWRDRASEGEDSV